MFLFADLFVVEVLERELGVGDPSWVLGLGTIVVILVICQLELLLLLFLIIDELGNRRCLTLLLRLLVVRLGIPCYAAFLRAGLG